MTDSERLLPRILASLLLLGSVAMSIPLAATVIALFRGQEIARAAWMTPLGVLATGAFLSWLLIKLQVPIRLYALAVTVWVVTASYVVMLSI